MLGVVVTRPEGRPLGLRSPLLSQPHLHLFSRQQTSTHDQRCIRFDYPCVELASANIRIDRGQCLDAFQPGLLHEGIDIGLGEHPGRVREQEFQTRGVLSAEMLRRLTAFQ
jgi:hypothetical protein